MAKAGSTRNDKRRNGKAFKQRPGPRPSDYSGKSVGGYCEETRMLREAKRARSATALDEPKPRRS